ncbi:MAG: hypothetical protein PHT60_02330 [Acidiphilium sp.]|nr:hypothetical protein [Acidiphilium sp.]MDD4934592.1 hypothetical protein [Acidiphilium sp.]
MGLSKNFLMIFGALLIILGVTALAIPHFTTQNTRDVAKVGDLKLQTQENTFHTIPTPVSGVAVLLGVVLIGAGLYRRP